MKYIIAISVAALFLAGCGQNVNSKYSDAEIAKYQKIAREPVPQATGGMMLSIRGQAISSEQVIAGLMAANQNAKSLEFDIYREQVYYSVRQYVTEKIADILIYERAISGISEEALEEDGAIDKAIDKDIRHTLARNDYDYSNVQNKLAQSGFDWSSYKEDKKRTMLIQSYFGSEIKDNKEIPYKELKDFYEAKKEESFKLTSKYEFELIHIPPTAENASELATEAYNAVKGGMNFSQAVKKYSQGAKAKIGGIWQTEDPSSFASPFDVLAEAIAKTEKGNVSQIFEKNGNYFILKLNEKNVGGYLAFDDVQNQIENYIKALKRSEKMDAIMKELFDKAKISEANDFIEYCIHQAYLRSKSS